MRAEVEECEKGELRKVELLRLEKRRDVGFIWKVIVELNISSRTSASSMLSGTSRKHGRRGTGGRWEAFCNG